MQKSDTTDISTSNALICKTPAPVHTYAIGHTQKGSQEKTQTQSSHEEGGGLQQKGSPEEESQTVKHGQEEETQEKYIK